MDREKRKQRKAAKSEATTKEAPDVSAEDFVEEEGEEDLSTAAVWNSKPRRRIRNAQAPLLSHPLPHHRHLVALGMCAPHPDLVPALMEGRPCEGLRVLQGPPGTGKTSALVALLSTVRSDMRVLLAAPTNVGAANLYARCVGSGWAEGVCAGTLPGSNSPGTVVLSDDPTRRLVCATVSGRSGPRLNHHSFDAIFLDEAAQCMEAWTWTLLRPEVRIPRLAGDVKQLPACVSESGLRLRHERSLMERLLLDLKYPLVDTLTVQHRMAPEILSYPNSTFYDGMLSCGAGAPVSGTLEWIRVPDGSENPLRNLHRQSPGGARCSQAGGGTQAGRGGRMRGAPHAICCPGPPPALPSLQLRGAHPGFFSGKRGRCSGAEHRAGWLRWDRILAGPTLPDCGPDQSQAAAGWSSSPVWPEDSSWGAGGLQRRRRFGSRR